MTLMKYHTEAGSERRWNPYDGGIVGAWSNGGCLRVLPEHLLVRMMNGVCPRNKRSQYVTSLSLFCAIGTSVIVFSSVFSVSLCALCSRPALSPHISEEPRILRFFIRETVGSVLFDYCPWKGKTMPDRTRLQPVHSYPCLLDFQTGVTCAATNACSGLNRALVGVQSGTFWMRTRNRLPTSKF